MPSVMSSFPRDSLRRRPNTARGQDCLHCAILMKTTRPASSSALGSHQRQHRQALGDIWSP